MGSWEADAAEQVRAAKQAVRGRVWALLERSVPHCRPARMAASFAEAVRAQKPSGPPAGRVLWSALLQRLAARGDGRSSPPRCRATGTGSRRRQPGLDRTG